MYFYKIENSLFGTKDKVSFILPNGTIQSLPKQRRNNVYVVNILP